MKVYLAGPMSGKPDYNVFEFRSVTDQLREAGYDVVSPIELDEADGLDFNEDLPAATEELWLSCLARDFYAIVNDGVQGLIMLEGWEESRGAFLELALARALGLPVLRWPDFTVVG